MKCMDSSINKNLHLFLHSSSLQINLMVTVVRYIMGTNKFPEWRPAELSVVNSVAPVRGKQLGGGEEAPSSYHHTSSH